MSKEVSYLGNIIHIVNIINNLPDAIIAVDLKGRVTFCNQAAENLFGYEVNEIKNQSSFGIKTLGTIKTLASKLNMNPVSVILLIFSDDPKQ